MKKMNFAFLGALILSLTACDTIKDTFGLNHYQPDEFNISENPPLILPPDYTLRPPMPGKANETQSAQNFDASLQAQKALLGTTATHDCSQACESSSEKNLINKASHDQATDPNIKDIINKEAEEEAQKLKLSNAKNEIKDNAAKAS